MKAKKPAQKTRRRSPEEIATLLARECVPDIPDLQSALEEPEGSQLWEEIVAAVAAETPANDNGLSRSSKKQVEAFETIQAALPTAALKTLLVKYDDALGTERATYMDAAYLVGVAVGRRIGGAR